ncbi:hypothetical protein F7R06_25810 [Pseudomonas moorei]|nr:hypothetical protein F7R06_25810 [Pseudomonas moorei]
MQTVKAYHIRQQCPTPGDARLWRLLSVGPSLLAIAVSQAPLMLDVQASSRASSLPQDFH